MVKMTALIVAAAVCLLVFSIVRDDEDF